MIDIVRKALYAKLVKWYSLKTSYCNRDRRIGQCFARTGLSCRIEQTVHEAWSGESETSTRGWRSKCEPGPHLSPVTRIHFTVVNGNSRIYFNRATLSFHIVDDGRRSTPRCLHSFILRSRYSLQCLRANSSGNNLFNKHTILSIFQSSIDKSCCTSAYSFVAFNSAILATPFGCFFTPL